MVAISHPWYNGSYTMAAKPIKTLEFHYTMIQFLIIRIIPDSGALYDDLVSFWDVFLTSDWVFALYSIF